MKRLILESDILKLLQTGNKVLPVGKQDIITPLAMDKIRHSGVKIISREEAEAIESNFNASHTGIKLNKISIGSDHTGLRVKSMLSKILSDKAFGVVDVGTYDETSCDYPDFAYAAAIQVKEKKVDFAVIIDATGIPSAITANKIPGIRAATCYNEFTARSAREHNNANVLVLGAKALGEETIKSILEVWLATKFDGGRHQKRLNKITAIEEQFSK